MKRNRLAFLLVSLLLSSCSSGSSAPSYKGNFLLNGFNSIKEMYKAQMSFDYRQYDFNAHLDIVTDAEYVREGEGALSISFREDYGHATPGYLLQRIDISPIAEGPVYDIDDVGVWIYNANDEEVNVTLAVFDKNTKTIATEDFPLPAGEYTQVEMDLSKLLMENSYSDILGFGIRLSDLMTATYYIDDWYVDFGAEYNDDDLRYLDMVNEINEEIESLPDVKSSDLSTDTELVSKVENIATSFYQLPSVYQTSVKSRQVLYDFIDAFNDTYYTQHSNDDDPVAMLFSRPFGIRQVTLLSAYPGINCYYDTDIHVEGQNGSLRMNYNGSNLWAYTNFTTQFTLSAYTSFSFSVYNDTDDRVALCMSWSPSGDLLPHTWTELTFRRDELRNPEESFLEVETTVVDPSSGNGGVIGVDGDLYFSDIVLHK